MNKRKCFLILFFFCCLALQTFAQAKKIHKCGSNVKGGEYKLVNGSYSMEAPKNLLLFITISPKNVNKDFMTQLAKRIKTEFCREDDVQVVIFDDPKPASGTSLSDYISSNGKIILMRGFYSFNKKNGKDVLEFSTRRGNPTTEMQIDFAAK